MPTSSRDRRDERSEWSVQWRANSEMTIDWDHLPKRQGTRVKVERALHDDCAHSPKFRLHIAARPPAHPGRGGEPGRSCCPLQHESAGAAPRLHDRPGEDVRPSWSARYEIELRATGGESGGHNASVQTWCAPFGA